MAYSKPGFIIHRGRASLETTSITFKGDSGNKDVVTMLKGRAGHSDGPFMATIAVDSALPSTGPEIDWMAVCASHEEIELGFKIAGDTFRFRGDVRDCEIKSQAEGTPNSVSFNFHASYLGML